MVAICRIEFFGGLRIIRGGDTISRFRTQKTAALLAFLAYHRDCAHPRETLIEMLWPPADLAAGRRSLSVALSSLRHQLEPPDIAAGAVLLADRNNVQLSPEIVTTDVAEFEEALGKAGRASDKLTKEQQLEEAILLYRGEFLAGLYEQWIPPEQVRLSERYAGAVAELAKLLTDRGETMEAASHLRRAIEAEPLREEPYRQLIRLNAEQGEPGAALAIYHELERVLAEELGSKPSGATRLLVEEVERLASRAQAPGLRSTSLVPARATRRRRKAESPSGIVTYLLFHKDQGVPADDHGDAQSLLEEFKRHGGTTIETGHTKLVVAAFGRPGDALSCAAQCQLREAAPGRSSTPYAMAIHTAEAAVTADRSHPGLDRAQRLLTAAHPAQILCSEATAGLLRYDLDGGLRLSDLGVYRLRGASATERIFQLDYPGGPDTPAPQNVEFGYVSHLPLQNTSFLGRRQELAQLKAMLSGDARLVTLVGSPGCGKTRLAVEVATQLVESFKGSVWFLSLADLREGSDILDRALDPLGIRRSPKTTALHQIAAALTEQEALLVFDNFEHLIESAAEVSSLLERLPDLRCLVTSRRLLHVTGERQFPVVPLPVPGEISLTDLHSNESVQLFVDRAQLVKPDFQLTPGNAEALAELCRRLEGVPLAIELAAARSQKQGLRQILERLARGEGLDTRSRDAVDRHRSLKAAVEWSCELLTPELQGFFARLSVFRGGCTVGAAKAVCEEPQALDCLAQLVECSLIIFEQGSLEPRYRMLEVVREYGETRLRSMGEEATTRHRHLECLEKLAQDSIGKMRGPDQRQWLERLDAEYDNLLAALEWSKAADYGWEKSLRLWVPLTDFWISRGRIGIGRSELVDALARDADAHPTFLRAEALNAAGVLAFNQGDRASARALWEDALAIRKHLGKSTSGLLHNLGNIAAYQGDFGRAVSLYEEALEGNREGGNERWVALNLESLGTTARLRGDLIAAQALLEESLEVNKRLGIPAPLTLISLSTVAGDSGDVARERSLLEEALAVSRQVGNRRMIAAVLGNLTATNIKLGNWELARTQFVEGTLLVRESSFEDATAQYLYLAATLVLRVEAVSRKVSLERSRRATRLDSAAEAATRCAGGRTPQGRKEGYEREIALLRDTLGDAAFEKAWEGGREMDLWQAIAYAVESVEGLWVREAEGVSR